MTRRRGLSRTNNSFRAWPVRILGMLFCNVGIVLFACFLLSGCEKETPPQPLPQESQEVVVEPETEVEEPKEEPVGEQKAEVEPSVPEQKTAEVPAAQQEVEEEPRPTPVVEAPKKPRQEIPGVAFTEKLIEVLDYELNGRFWGWRPNDLLVGRFTDNVNEFQLGVLEASRYTAIKLKESLTRFGDADAYDPHLVEAVNLLMNRADQFWFPSAESQYKAALEELRAFLNNLKKGRSRFYYRTDNLLSLVASYKDLLGNCHENLVKDEETDGSRVSHFRADNYFYYSQGVAHVMYEILKTVRVGFVVQLQTIDAVALMDKIVEDLGRASECSPWLITNGEADDILANHRYNLSASISSALHNMSTMLRY